VEIAEDNSFVIDRSLDSTSFRAATGYVAPDWNEMIERMALDPTPYDLYRK
jgi:dTDP-4-dehydrorhamnose reductase